MPQAGSDPHRWRRRMAWTVVGGVGAVSMSLALLVAYGSSPWLRLAWGFMVAMQAYGFGTHLTRVIESSPSASDVMPPGVDDESTPASDRVAR